MICWLIFIILLLCIGASLFFVFESNNESNNGEEKTTDTSQFTNLQGQFTDVLITDDESAIYAVRDGAEILGLKNAANELSVISHNELDGLSYYRLQQYHCGIPVNGRTFTVISDSNGVVKGLNGNAIDISEDVSKMRLSSDELSEAIFEFLSTTGVTIDASDICITETDLQIDNFEEFKLKYIVKAQYGEASDNFIVDATTLDVSYAQAAYEPYTLEICYANKDETINNTYDIEIRFNGLYDLDQKRYLLFDTQDGIYCYDAGGKETYNYTKNQWKNKVLTPIGNDSNIFEQTEYVPAFMYSSRIKNIKSFFVNNYNNPGYEKLILAINSGTGTTGGVVSSNEIFNKLDEKYFQTEDLGYIQIGNEYVNAQTLAHEYTHTITNQQVHWRYTPYDQKNEARCINEAYSDLFGMFFVSDADTLSWHTRTDIIDPTKDNYFVNVSEVEKNVSIVDAYVGGASGNTTFKSRYVEATDSADTYVYAVVLQHAAYLMHKDGGGELSTEELMDIWYHTMLRLPSNCTFDELRNIMEYASVHLNYSTSKTASISKAFDSIGVVGKRDVPKGSSVSVIAKNQLYDNYHITIKNIDSGKIVMDTTITNAYSIDLGFECGTYSIVVQDNADSGSENTFGTSINLISPNGVFKNNIIIYTDFGMEDAVSVDDAYSIEQVYTVDKWNESTNISEPTTVTASYEIPKITISNKNMDWLNESIYNRLHPLIETSLSEISDLGYPQTSNNITYRWFLSEDFLSLLVSIEAEPDFGSGNQYIVYNISTSTGLEVTNDIVYIQKNLLQQEYLEKVKQALGSCYWGDLTLSNEIFRDTSYVDIFNQQYEKTVSDANIGDAIPYISETGHLCVIAKIYSMAGSEYYYENINLETFTLHPNHHQRATLLFSDGTTNCPLISEENAAQMAREYWNIQEGSGYVVDSGGLIEYNGASYYYFQLKGSLESTNLTTLDYLYIDAVKGDFYFGITYPEELIKTN